MVRQRPERKFWGEDFVADIRIAMSPFCVLATVCAEPPVADGWCG